MAKTELTKQIETALQQWSTTSLGGKRLNRFRTGFCALEVPAENGATTGGMIDFVSIDECFLSETDNWVCGMGRYKDTPFAKKYAEAAGCQKKEYPEEPCDNQICNMRRNHKNLEEGVLVTCVEIKISVSDFHSKHGHNFVGNCNYYAMPTELYRKVKDQIPDDVGVLLFYDGRYARGVRKQKECVYHELSEETQKWLILSTAKRAFKQIKDAVIADCAACKQRQRMKCQECKSGKSPDAVFLY